MIDDPSTPEDESDPTLDETMLGNIANSGYTFGFGIIILIGVVILVLNKLKNKLK